MAEVSRDALKEKRDRLAALRASNAEKQKEQSAALSQNYLVQEDKRLEQDIAYEEWAASILDGTAEPETPPDNSQSNPQVAPPNNASLSNARLGGDDDGEDD